ncbi:UDP-N-acetylmuramoyl-L-alanyl-D-glutamate--2,6-diaminopimelate ligase [Inconstantimicrobium mannanitabidum]|uniref:UDP-N-acetylmuramoyl-L-alanyl-D-glutamate--2, 6-diaminopimelate ligase n=1 Tax=Inconstantimicrobium mannanitabidum TaxID=1604901 RepID=A0ACB5RAH8_9CLOT|nr:UDP-N-acetylmuramoyl-L-alanyl-D-glutamate--2,6-diaminopimelate ligase [Clostridium sp. TW13]GKX66117.1 UDP-N-acetylmuramoyl-L-alanyl-D-glutamate--2,6-diaminopimelate ligase [Clostridium sp. TW13]
MLLKNLLEGLDYQLVSGDVNREIGKICYDNRKVSKDDLFVCVKGFSVDGHTFAEKATENGATVVVCEDEVKVLEGVTVIKVDNTRRALAKIASNYYGNPSKKLKVIGITGTNGKTTSSYIIRDVLTKAGNKVGLIGTIANYIGDKKFKTERTTPESLELQELFKQMVDEGANYCVMEVSSHALALDRVYDVEFDYAIFTNLTRDHLDMHKTFEEYYKAKFKLFKMANNCIINIDDDYGKRIIEDLEEDKKSKNIVTISLKQDADYTAENILLGAMKSEFDTKGKKYEMEIPGLYNVYNSLGCIAVCDLLKLSYEKINAALKEATVPGRCQRVGKSHNLDFTIIVDYAHTPDGLENILSTVKQVTKGRVIAVFGCGGNRDTVKRPQMGEIATRIADIAIVTSDNPRKEEPALIIEDILKGIKDKDNCITIENRYDAIKKAIELAKSEDSVVIAGKGHEDYQILKDETIHFDDREVVEEILQNRNEV